MFARFTFSALALLLASSAFAAEPAETIVLWPEGAPARGGTSAKRRAQPNKPGDTMIRLANVSSPTLAVYKPAADKNTGAAVVICPGGGYRILA